MSFVSVVPDVVIGSATQLAGIGNALDEARGAAASRTTAVVTAADDEVSIAIAELFSGHAQSFQALSAQAAAFHDQLVETMSASAGSYALTEAASSNPLANIEQVLLGVLNAPFVQYTGRPLFGIGANAAPGSGQNGGPGGWLGNGGAGGAGAPGQKGAAPAAVCPLARAGSVVPAARPPLHPAATAEPAGPAGCCSATAGSAGPAEPPGAPRILVSAGPVVPAGPAACLDRAASAGSAARAKAGSAGLVGLGARPDRWPG